MTKIFFSTAISLLLIGTCSVHAAEVEYNAKDSAGREPIHAKGYDNRPAHRPNYFPFIWEKECASIESGKTLNSNSPGFHGCQLDQMKRQQ